MEKWLHVVVVALHANVIIHPRVFVVKFDYSWSKSWINNLAILLQVDLVSANKKGDVAGNSPDGRTPFLKVVVGLPILQVEEEN